METELQAQLQGDIDRPIIIYDQNNAVVWQNDTAKQLLGNCEGHKFEDVIAAYQPVIKPLTVQGKQLKAAIFPNSCDCEDIQVLPVDAPLIFKKANYAIMLLGNLQKKKESVLIGAGVVLVLTFLFVFGRVIYRVANDPRVIDAIIETLDRSPAKKSAP
jgi:hypothetical protein